MSRSATISDLLYFGNSILVYHYLLLKIINILQFKPLLTHVDLEFDATCMFYDTFIGNSILVYHYILLKIINILQFKPLLTHVDLEFDATCMFYDTPSSPAHHEFP